MSFEVRTGLSITGPSPAAKRSFSPMGSTGQQQVGENDGRIHIQDFYRLKRYLSCQIGAFADFQNSVVLADVPVLLQIASSLSMNHTGRTSVGRRRQASRKRLVIGARASILVTPCTVAAKRLWATSSERHAPGKKCWARPVGLFLSPS